MSSTEQAAIGERADLVETLRNHRYFLRYTVRDLTDEQAARRTTASELSLGAAAPRARVPQSRQRLAKLSGQGNDGCPGQAACMAGRVQLTDDEERR